MPSAADPFAAVLGRARGGGNPSRRTIPPHALSAQTQPAVEQELWNALGLGSVSQRLTVFAQTALRALANANAAATEGRQEPRWYTADDLSQFLCNFPLRAKVVLDSARDADVQAIFGPQGWFEQLPDKEKVNFMMPLLRAHERMMKAAASGDR